jgi:hypothetical protein
MPDFLDEDSQGEEMKKWKWIECTRCGAFYTKENGHGTGICDILTKARERALHSSSSP